VASIPALFLFSKLKGAVVEIHLKDMIKAFFIIKGAAIDFFGAIYLKNGVLPEAACRIIFPDGKTIVAKKADMTLEELGDIMYGHSYMIAEKYGYPLLHIPIPDGIDQDVLVDILYSPKKNMAMISMQGLLN